MYLVINLAVIDMVFGGVKACGNLYALGLLCNLWKWNSIEEVSLFIVVSILSALFLAASFTNVAIISLERVHATFFPFRHRVLKKWVYRLVIAVVWVTSGLITICIIFPPLVQFDLSRVYDGLYLGATFCLICLLIICVSYSSIVIKVRNGAQPRHHGAASRERKLTMTLLIVTVVSLLLRLPNVILIYFVIPISQSWSLSLRLHLVGGAFEVLLLANSIANPLLYAMSMPEYRSALLALFRKRLQQQRQVAVFPLRDM